jgi:hypothetical protein
MVSPSLVERRVVIATKLTLHCITIDVNYFMACGQFSTGTMLTLFCLQNILDRVLSRRLLEQYPKLQQVLASGSLYMERNMKKAATFKINVS